MNNTIYKHYIAIDWSIENMAIARMTKKSNKIIKRKTGRWFQNDLSINNERYN